MCKKSLFCTILLLVFAVVVNAANKSFTLVIDAGHGGRDDGACGAISKEKDLTLKYALAFGKLVERECPDVRVIYTRKTDVFVELKERAAIANRAKADLFMSIHINAMPGRKIARGFQTYTLGKGSSGNGMSTNLEVAKRENSVILLEDNYKQSYQGFDPDSPESNIMFEFVQDRNMEQSVNLAKLLQRNVCAATGKIDGGAHQANLAVLRLSSMPGCLIELGFISTADEERFLNNPESVALYSRGIMNAFNAYRGRYDKIVNVPYRTPDQVLEDTPAPRTKKRGKSKGDEENIVLHKQDSASEVQNVAVREKNNDNNKVKPQVVKAEPKVVKVEPKAAVAANKPVFKVQILVSSRKLKNGDPHLKGLTDYDFYQEAGYCKYTVGESANYNEIYRLRKQILDKFPEAFIIAFKNGAKMNVNEAIREFKNNR
ncbi:MAG: N-acetylmuramoyl-L-alanine amidase [Prevotella sp.]|nr:N-acetylmuramoyl-L-alanine amidase [Prevotella sp.]MDD7709133.1 N-acetylmuramoyl-L-alanine amidase [Prevotella sp.]MDY4150205.1 N-acetylmuramoyl-L-alanine amidase [Prevotella sp.]